MSVTNLTLEERERFERAEAAWMQGRMLERWNKIKGAWEEVVMSNERLEAEMGYPRGPVMDIAELSKAAHVAYRKLLSQTEQSLIDRIKRAMANTPDGPLECADEGCEIILDRQDDTVSPSIPLADQPVLMSGILGPDDFQYMPDWPAPVSDADTPIVVNHG